MIQDQIVYDGDTEIIYSGVFNIYEGRLTIEKILGFRITFLFKDDPTIPGSQMQSNGDNGKKIITITLTNFNNSLGTGTTNKLQLLTDDDGKAVFFSIHVTSLGGNSTLRQTVVTFYKSL